MRGRNSFLALAAGALAVLPLAACGTTPEAGELPTSLATTVLPLPPSATTTAAAGTALDPALQQTLDAATRRYWATQLSVYLDPTQDLTAVDGVATGAAADSLRSQAEQLIAKDQRTSGTVNVVRTNLGTVNPSPIVEGQQATAVVRTCLDVSGLQFTNSDGSSAVDPNRLPQNQSTLTFVNPTPADSAGWRVSEISQGPAIPCDSAS